MARKPEVLAVAPLLPATSVDFNAMHDAISAGATAEEAVAAATGEPLAEPLAPEPSAPADDGEAA